MIHKQTAARTYLLTSADCAARHDKCSFINVDASATAAFAIPNLTARHIERCPRLSYYCAATPFNYAAIHVKN